MLDSIQFYFQRVLSPPFSKWLVSLVLFFLLANVQGGANSKLNTFMKLYQRAHAAHSYSQIAELINWRGVHGPMRKTLEAYASGTFGLQIKGIEIRSVDEHEYQSIELAGERMYPNMPVTHIMSVYFEIDESDPASAYTGTTVYLLGEQEKQVKIAVYVSDSADSDWEKSPRLAE